MGKCVSQALSCSPRLWLNLGFLIVSVSSQICDIYVALTLIDHVNRIFLGHLVCLQGIGKSSDQIACINVLKFVIDQACNQVREIARFRARYWNQILNNHCQLTENSLSGSTFKSLLRNALLFYWFGIC